MIFLAVFFLLLFALAVIFAWLVENPGSITIEWAWLGKSIEVTLLQGFIALGLLVLVCMFIWIVVSAVLKSPKTFGRWRAGRRRDKGYQALSRGLVAAGAGNAPMAKKLAKESGKLLENEPLVAMLDAQTALLEGDRPLARKQFEAMMQNDETKLLGLRGLYIEAEQEGAAEAASHFAKEANTFAPGTPWAAKAVLRSQSLSGDWEAALRTLGLNNSNGMFEKAEFVQKRSVLLTAQAMEQEDSEPEKAKANALAAHKVAPSLVPAALVAARTAIRLNDNRKAGKVLEATWKLAPHPEIAGTYINLKSDDTAKNKLKRAEALAKKQPEDPESDMALAQYALEAGEFGKARDAMERVLSKQPSERACLIMADIEEAEHGDRGRVREWLSRAVTAPKDPAWTADGVTSEKWAPFSPVTGKLGAFEWVHPVAQLAGPNVAGDYVQLLKEPLSELPKAVETVTTVIEPANQDESKNKPSDEDVEAEEAEIIDITPSKDEKDADSDSASELETSKDKETEDATTTASVVTAAATLAGTSAASEKEGASETSSSTTPEDDAPNAVQNTSGEKSDDQDKNGDQKPKAGKSPFRSTKVDIDSDADGVIDHRPDDPGIADDKPTKKKGLFF